MRGKLPSSSSTWAWSLRANCDALETRECQWCALQPNNVSPLFQPAAEATAEAIYNSLFMATTARSHDLVQEKDLVVERLPLAPFLRGRKPICH
jgi:hypothetical protein